VTPTDAQTANLLGALALVITDQISGSITAGPGRSLSDAAALSALHQFLEGATLDQLRNVLGLTPSGAVRLVDRLAAADLVIRGPGTDGRTRAVTLTVQGRREADRISASRAGYLAGMLSGLSEDESRTLHHLLGKVMANVVEAKDGGSWICRLCDLHACGRAEGNCPTARAATVKYRLGILP
jgi:DNA-binding MarR family transcriptional regulator